MAVLADTRQRPLFAVKKFLPKTYDAGSLYDVMARYGDLIIREQDWPDVSHVQGGTWSYCPVLMSKLVVLQRAGGWTDRETVRRASYDLMVKDCLGLGVEQRGPSQSKLCRHRQAMQQKGLHEVYHHRFVALLKTLELVDKQEAVLVDSVPIEGAGQVMDSYNLLAAGIRRALNQLGEHTGQPAQQVARRLGLSEYLDRGIKGRLGVDWDSEQGPRQLLTRLVADAGAVQAEIERLVGASAEPTVPGEAVKGASPAAGPQAQGADVQAAAPKTEEPGGTEQKVLGAEPRPEAREVALEQEAIGADPQDPTEPPSEAGPTPTEPSSKGDSAARGPSGPSDATSSPPGPRWSAQSSLEPLKQTAAALAAVIAHDVEWGPDGQVKGVLQRPAGDRLISMTDPDMRHGRKSASVLIAGYKAQVVASLLWGFILLTKVFRANQHDGENLPQLLAALAGLGLRPRKVIGDHAYGTVANHAHVAQGNAQGLYPAQELVARMARPQNGGRFTKDQFQVDLERRTVTCPAGQPCAMTRWATRDQDRGWEFEFPEAVCGACPLRSQCINPKSKGGGRTVFIVEQKERLIRGHLVRRQELDFIALLSQRPDVERVIAGLAQCGGKQAHRMGQDNVSFDETLSALAYNLRRLGAVLKQNPEVASRLEAEALVFLCLVLVSLGLASVLRRRAEAGWRRAVWA
jgi:Transposase DDE domain/Transposase domain (DUF772)